MRGSAAWCHVSQSGQPRHQTGLSLMTGRLYVNTASNEIIGDLGIIMDWMDIGLGTGLARKESGEIMNYNENKCVGIK